VKLEKALKEANPALEVSINPEKPRKGCFEVRVGEEPILSLLAMPRPFPVRTVIDRKYLDTKDHAHVACRD